MAASVGIYSQRILQEWDSVSMHAHQQKKTSMLRELGFARRFRAEE
jgi:hypothetical protein